jgi:hypothetical protein
MVFLHLMVLFCDLVGSTAIAGQLNHEEYTPFLVHAAVSCSADPISTIRRTSGVLLVKRDATGAAKLC